MRCEIKFCDLARARSELHGATAGEDAYVTMLAPVLAGAAGSSAIVILGLRGVEWVTASFLKATWLKARVSSEAGPLAVAHLSDEVRSEFDIFCKGHRLPGLEAKDWNDQGIAVGTLHGHIEDTSWEALQFLIANPGATAPGLHALSRDSVSPTAWTNRLNELCRLGLAVRRRSGRAWNFFAIMREVRRG